MARNPNPQSPKRPSTMDALEYPGAPLAVGSPFYVERPPIETQALSQLALPGSLLRLKAPRRMGKTSLAFRLIDQAKQMGYSVAVVDFQQAEAATLSNLDELLHWFCNQITRRLGLTARLEDDWRANLGAKLNCTLYVQNRILRIFESPVVLVLRQVDALFDYPETAKEFFPLLRGWFEDARWQPIWQKLRLVLTHATDLYLPLKLHQSPFNVGFNLKLPRFTLEQVQVLAHHYQLDDVTPQQIRALSELMGGHPYLVAIAFYHLANASIAFEQLIQQAALSGGIYSSHLRDYASLLAANPALLKAIHQVIEAPAGAVLDPVLSYQLESAGLIVLNGDQATISCELYRRYLEHYYPKPEPVVPAPPSLSTAASESISMLTHRLRLVEQETHELLQQLNIDDATQFLKRIPFQNHLAQLWDTAPVGQASTLMLCSVDYFSVYVEANGLDRGDACLRLVADVIRKNVSQSVDHVARYGTESFLVYLSDITADRGQAIAQAVRTNVEALQIQHAPQYLGLPLPVVTVSIGLVTVCPNQLSLRAALDQVDQALQQAIRTGHNRVNAAA
ncbi:MAG: AAA-like domain-containing protein [Cyanobacteria bacterium J06632_22]